MTENEDPHKNLVHNEDPHKNLVHNEDLHRDLVHYGDPLIVSGDAKIAWWLKLTYIVLPIWGIIWFYLYWNGLSGWFDPGYWDQLEKAANTTYPYHNFNEGSPPQK